MWTWDKLNTKFISVRVVSPAVGSVCAAFYLPLIDRDFSRDFSWKKLEYFTNFQKNYTFSRPIIVRSLGEICNTKKRPEGVWFELFFGFRIFVTSRGFVCAYRANIKKPKKRTYTYTSLTSTLALNVFIRVFTTLKKTIKSRNTG